ncbi:MAG: hypothetical protein P3T54_04975 [Dehalogenimonas sp.]|uniref:Uncharacterized protein n=1 Tax=Candidatus Dehalogenimonas loeffleri TaxID=3127115 RepID=A0ABZ2J755_9CHLR|nr:hypothetical protein [Dehalogenimonas sp.]
MSEELSKIERPTAASFSGKRKLYVVPLLYQWPDAPAEYQALFHRYWSEVTDQLNHLEDRIGAVAQIYHEGIDSSGDAAVATLKQFENPSYDITQARLSKNAALTPIEDRELMNESIDWERFVMMGFASSKVARLATENLMAVAKKRYEHIGSRITETLKDNEAGILFMREGHQIQFPATIEVFSVSPPSLDEIHRYLRNAQERPQPQAQPEEHAAKAEEPAGQPEAPKKPRKAPARKKKTA